MTTTTAANILIPRPILKRNKNINSKKKSVIFNEAMNLFYDCNDCHCWLREGLDDSDSDLGHYHNNEIEPQPTLSPPEGYKDKVFNLNHQYYHQQIQQHQNQMNHPDLTIHQQHQQNYQPNYHNSSGVGGGGRGDGAPPSPPSAKRKVFLYQGEGAESGGRGGGGGGGEELCGDEGIDLQRRRIAHQQVYQHQLQRPPPISTINTGQTLNTGGGGGILKGGRLWRSNSSEASQGKSPQDEPDLLKSLEGKGQQQIHLIHQNNHNKHPSPHPPLPPPPPPTLKISTGTAPLSTSEQIRLAVAMDNKHSIKINKQKSQECSSLVEKLRWLTSLDDDDEDLEDLDNTINYSTWPSRDLKINKKDAGTTMEISDEISNNKDDKDYNKYGEAAATTDDYGFSHRPSVKGVKVRGGSGVKGLQEKGLDAQGHNAQVQVIAHAQQNLQHTHALQSQYENLNSEKSDAPPPPPPPTSSSNLVTPATQSQQQNQQSDFKTNFQIIRQSFENNAAQQQRPYSWSTLPHNHFKQPPPRLNLQLQQQQQQPGYYGTLQQQQPINKPDQPIYGTIRRVPNVIGRPLFLHYTALSVEAHPNKIIYPKQLPQQPLPVVQQQQQQQQTKHHDTSPTTIQMSHYYGPPIRYYNSTVPPVPPPTVPCNNLSNPLVATTTSQSFNYNIQPVYHHPHVNLMCEEMLECRGTPEGRDEGDGGEEEGEGVGGIEFK